MPVSPPGSVAVRVSSRYEGYSWSGALKLPEATPSQLWTGCWWQWPASSQWLRTSDHDRAEAGRVPLWASVAPPEKLTVSPTFQRRLEDGLAMVAIGGVLPAVTVTASVSLAPRLSVTRSSGV